MSYDPFRQAEHEGIRVLAHPLIGANGLWLPDRRTILLRPGMSSALERSVLAHELAHAELGHLHATGPGSARQERAADRLAARRLIDPASLARIIAGTEDAGRAALELGVTPQLLQLWLAEHGPLLPAAA